MTDASRDDIAAMRRQGDLRAYLRAQIAAGATRRDHKPQPATPRPGHRPGAWPAGSQPPAAPPPIPDTVARAALADHARWFADGQPPGDQTCHCPPCHQTDGAPDAR